MCGYGICDRQFDSDYLGLVCGKIGKLDFGLCRYMYIESVIHSLIQILSLYIPRVGVCKVGTLDIGLCRYRICDRQFDSDFTMTVVM